MYIPRWRVLYSFLSLSLVSCVLFIARSLDIDAVGRCGVWSQMLCAAGFFLFVSFLFFFSVFMLCLLLSGYDGMVFFISLHRGVSRGSMEKM